MAKNEPNKPDETAPANETPKEQTAPVSEPLAVDKQPSNNHQRQNPDKEHDKLAYNERSF